MPYLGNIPATQFSSLAYQDLTGGTGTAFTLDNAVGSAQDIEVFVNNVRQEPGVAYTVSGTSLTMTGSIVATDDFYIVFQGKSVASVTHPSNSALNATTGTFTKGAVSQTAQTNDVVLLKNDGNGYLKVYGPNTSTGGIAFGDTDDPFIGAITYHHDANYIRFYGNNAERARIDSSGNLLVGKTSADGAATAGLELRNDGTVRAARSSTIGVFNRLSSDGNLVEFEKDGSNVGSIGVDNSDNLYIQGNSSHAGLQIGSTSIIAHANGSTTDNTVDLGTSNTRFDDIFATNGTIQTSDANEKQQIASLTSAEITAAKALSQLFKTYKWNSAVESKGDDARTHTGVIAQEVQQAMTDAGLDAGDYAFFISSTWWETSTEVPAVEADEENGIEAQEAYTRIDTYETAEEAPEGATQRTRLGVRYPELLAFIGAATEQRLADIETRLTALEGA